MDSNETSFANSTPATSLENSTVRDGPLHDCVPRCPHGAAASRDFIARIIRHASETDVQDGSKRFISRQTLVNDLSAGTVASLLSACPRWRGQRGTRADEAAAYISPEAGRCPCGKPRCTGARIIFVVLSLITREEHVWDLVGSRICDGDLPLCIRETHLVSCHDESRRLPEAMRGWAMDEKRLFCHFQWAMLSPYLERTAVSDVEIRKLAVEVSLPWCEYEDPKEDGGAPVETPQPVEMSQFDESKTVMKRVKISRHYHDLDDEDGHFGLKCQRRRKMEWRTFENEVAGNARTVRRHKHIIPLLAAFNHAGLCYMLFPWAEGGNLDALWERHAAPPGKDGPADPSWRTPAWVWDQCCGLAGALSFIHGYPVDKERATPQWHADIQPRNILCSRTTDPRGGPSYTLQISDFEFSQEFEAPDSETTKRYPNVAAWYYPPELRMAENEEVRITLKWDVWCLACVYLELLSWFAFGHDKGIKQFAKERVKISHEERALDALKLVPEHEAKFFRLVDTAVPRSRFMRRFRGRSTVMVGAEVSPAVVKHTMQLKKWWSKDKEWWREDRIQGLFSLIKDKMLVTNVDSRVTSEKVLGVLTSNV